MAISNSVHFDVLCEFLWYLLCCPVRVPHKSKGFCPLCPVIAKESVHTPAVVSVMSKLSKSNRSWHISITWFWRMIIWQYQESISNDKITRIYWSNTMWAGSSSSVCWWIAWIFNIGTILSHSSSTSWNSIEKENGFFCNLMYLVCMTYFHFCSLAKFNRFIRITSKRYN